MMKNTLKLFCISLVLMLIAALCALPMSAADNVIFIAGEGAGTGDGSSAENALIPTKGNFDPTASSPARQKDIALYQAWMKLMELGGGTIVVCGPVTLDINSGQSNSETIKDVMVYDRSTHRDDVTITYTSVYNGVDYRQTADAKIILDRPAMLIFPTATVLENITFQPTTEKRAICGGSHKLTLGAGTTFEPCDPTKADDPMAYPILVGGERYKKHEGNPDITIDIGSGVIGHVYGGQYGAGENYPLTGDTLITIKSGTILGDVGGGSRAANTPVNGNSKIVIDGGVFKGTINAIGEGGFVGDNATAVVKINGGDFSECFGIYDSSVSIQHNIAKYALLDLSDADNATAAIVLDNSAGFHETLLPDGYVPVTTTAASETTAAPTATETTAAPTTTETTAAPTATETTTASAVTETTAAPTATETTAAPTATETTAAPTATETTTAPTATETTAAPTATETTAAPTATETTTAPAATETTAAPETTVAPETTAAPEAESSNTGLIIGIVAVVVVVIVVVAVIALKKKKA